jgi:hypothetical protein
VAAQYGSPYGTLMLVVHYVFRKAAPSRGLPHHNKKPWTPRRAPVPRWGSFISRKTITRAYFDSRGNRPTTGRSGGAFEGEHGRPSSLVSHCYFSHFIIAGFRITFQSAGEGDSPCITRHTPYRSSLRSAAEISFDADWRRPHHDPRQHTRQWCAVREKDNGNPATPPE